MLYIASPVKAAFYDGAGGLQGPAAVSYGRANYELAIVIFLPLAWQQSLPCPSRSFQTI